MSDDDRDDSHDDPRKVRERKILRAHADKVDSPWRHVIRMKSDSGVPTAYEVTNGCYTDDLQEVTLFLYAEQAAAVASELGPRAEVVRVKTRVVKGVRVPVLPAKRAPATRRPSGS